MIETVSRKVAPSEEQNTINLMAIFAWKLKSSQEINTKDSHLERHGDTIYSVTTKENYVKLIFERKTNLKNYQRIVQLEHTYFSLLNSKPRLSKLKLLGVIFLFFLACGFNGFLGIIFDILSLGLGGWLFVSTYKKKKIWNEQMQTQGPAILNEARSILW